MKPEKQKINDENYQTNRPEENKEEAEDDVQHANTDLRIEQAEVKALEGLEKERKLATEMGQIPEAIEPEDT